MTLGQLLKTTRTKLGKTLREVEGITGISNGYLSQLESDSIRQPSPNHLHRLAEAYALEYARLMTLAGYVPVAEFGAVSGAGTKPPLDGVADLSEEDRRKIQAYIDDLRAAKRGRTQPHGSDDSHGRGSAQGK
jgi:HTH-type transcriptional regulator, competence development regulator